MEGFILYNPKAADMTDVFFRDLRVLFLSDAIAGRNGVGSYYEDLVKHLKGYIAHAELVSPGLDTGDYTHGLNFPMPGDPTQQVYLPKAGKIYDKIKSVAPDVIIVATPGPYGLFGFVIARYLGIPLCAAYHTRYEKLTELYWSSAFSGISRLYMKWFNRILFRASKQVVANSEEMIAEAERDGAKNPVMIGTSIARLFLSSPSAALSAEFKSVCYAGRLALEKNIHGILQAAKSLPGIRFTIAGDGPLRDEVAAHAKTFANIEYAGWISRKGTTLSSDPVKLRRIFLKAGVLILLVLGLYLLYQLTGLTQNMEEAGPAEKLNALRSFIDSLGYLGPAAFVAVSAVAIMVYIPAVIIVCVAVCIFGGVTGALLATASIYLAVTAVYFTAQFLGRELVVRVAGREFGKFESRLAGKGLVTVIYMRLFFFVFPPTNWLLGLSALRFRDVFLGTVLGTVHHIIIFSWMTEAVLEVNRTGGSLNPLATKELLIPILAGIVVFVSIHIISCRIRRSKPT